MSIYEEVEIEDMTFDATTQIYYYACPCGDKFFIPLEDLLNGEDIATCPSCTLRIRVIFDEDSLPPLREEDEDGENNAASLDNENKTDNSNKEKDVNDVPIESLSISNEIVNVEA